MPAPSPTQWCILRMSGGSTLPVAQSLAEAGFDVWTPVEVQQSRKPRSKVKVERRVPIMPTYVFARAARLADLIAIAKAPTSPHPQFSVFHYAGRIPLIADRSLEPLRAAERDKTRVKDMPVFTKGERVKLTEGGFAGMSGVVELSKGKFTLVAFPGFQVPIRISSLLLLPDAATKAA